MQALGGRQAASGTRHRQQQQQQLASPGARCSFSGRHIVAPCRPASGRPLSRRMTVEAVRERDSRGGIAHTLARNLPCLLAALHAPHAETTRSHYRRPLISSTLPAQAVAPAAQAVEGGGPAARPRDAHVFRAHHVPGAFMGCARWCVRSACGISHGSRRAARGQRRRPSVISAAATRRECAHDAARCSAAAAHL